MVLSRLLVITVAFLSAMPVAAQPPRDWWPHRHEPVQGPRIGVLVEELSFRDLDALELPYGVRVTRVLPASPADTAGIRAGDIILHLDTQPVYSVRRLQWLAGKASAGGTLVLRFYRDGTISDVDVSLDSPPEGARPQPEARSTWLWQSADYLGAGLQSLTPGLREALAVPGGLGALVTEVYANGPAEQAGLRPGDVIVKMDRRDIMHIADVERVLDYFESGEQLTLKIIRDKREQQITLTLGERRDIPGRRDPWMVPQGETLPFFDPEWWRELEDFTERWRRYWERGDREQAPRGAV